MAQLMLSILQGRVRHEYGPGLKQVIGYQAGDHGHERSRVTQVEHLVRDARLDVDEVARSDATEWEHIIPYDRNRAS